jgi:hypothetical protein
MFAFLYFIVIGAVLFLTLRMTCGPCVMGHAGNDASAGPRPRIPVITLGWALSLFLTATYVVCVGFDLIFPGYAMYAAWINLMPGMTWLSWPSFLIGLIEAFAYGWYGALIFGGLFNAIAART